MIVLIALEGRCRKRCSLIRGRTPPRASGKACDRWVDDIPERRVFACAVLEYRRLKGQKGGFVSKRCAVKGRKQGYLLFFDLTKNYAAFIARECTLHNSTPFYKTFLTFFSITRSHPSVKHHTKNGMAEKKTFGNTLYSGASHRKRSNAQTGKKEHKK